jgi:microcystin degradation protein MlrC
MKRVALIGLKQETNTFNRLETGRETFASSVHVAGEAMEGLAGRENEISGFYEALRDSGVTPVPVLFAEAPPGGPVTRDFFERFRREMVEGLEPRLDGVLLALHGALVVSGLDDAQADLVEDIRKRCGASLPIVATFDFHANLSDRLVAMLSGLVAYETHPHVDQENTGRRGARLLLRLLEEGGPYSLALVRVPALLSPHNIRTEARTPMAAMIALAREAEQSAAGVRSASIFAGFPNADTPDTSASVVVTATSEPVARRSARRLAEEMWQRRQEFNPHLPTLEEAIQEVRRLRGQGLVVACEFADGIGQGGATDGTGVLEALLRHKLENVAHGPLADRDTVGLAIQAGVGNQVAALVGGKIDTDNFRPLRITGRVKLISDGQYIVKSPVRKGMLANMGRTAVIRLDGIDLVVTEHRVFGYDPTLFRSVGIEPLDRDAVFIKQGTLAQAAYLSIAKRLILMSTPGWGSTEYTQLPYTKVRRPIFPLDERVEFAPRASGG